MVRTVTHEKLLVDCEAETEEFLEAVSPLGAKLRCILLQFGYFNKKAFAGPDPFLERLDRYLESFSFRAPVAVEIRNKWWLKPALFAALARHEAAFVVCDHVWMPPVDRVLAEHPVLTGPLLYLRLIGDRQGIEKVTTTWEKTVVDRTDRLERIAAALGKVSKKADIMAFINNHFAGHAPATCREFARLLGAGK